MQLVMKGIKTMKLAKSKMPLLAAVAMFAAAAGAASTAQARGKVPTDEPVVFVTSQGLYFDSIVQTMLPQKGPFQQLFMTAHGLETEFGPGDVGYLGGRWKEDFDGDGEFNYFLCPLLGPGRDQP